MIVKKSQANKLESSRFFHQMVATLAILMLGLALPVAAKYRQPTTQQAQQVSLGQGLTGADLERIKIGHQAGLLKVVSSDGTTVKFIKGDAKLGALGIDGREWAPLTSSQRDQVVKALGITDTDALARSLMANYTQISRAHALALLGLLCYPGQDSASLTPELRTKTLQFLRNRLQPAEDNVVRRQAVLALAIQPETDEVSVAAILNFMRRDLNAWNTFGTVQFFDYHSDFIRKMSKYQGFLTQLIASDNPHADQILRTLRAEPKDQSVSIPPMESAPPVEDPRPPSARPTPIPNQS